MISITSGIRVTRGPLDQRHGVRVGDWRARGTQLGSSCDQGMLRSTHECQSDSWMDTYICNYQALLLFFVSSGHKQTKAPVTFREKIQTPRPTKDKSRRRSIRYFTLATRDQLNSFQVVETSIYIQNLRFSSLLWAKSCQMWNGLLSTTISPLLSSTSSGRRASSISITIASPGLSGAKTLSSGHQNRLKGLHFSVRLHRLFTK